MLLSVIIPTLNRSKCLSVLLESLAAQQPVSFAWEILVVDNGSTDDTREVVQDKIYQMPVQLRYIYEPKPGLHQGRHRGTREASGELVAFLDDDTVLASDWNSGVELILAKKADAVVSRILPKWEEPPPAWLAGLMKENTFGPLTLLDQGNQPKPIDPFLVWGASFFIRRALVTELGGFHPDGMPPELLRYRGDGETGFFRKFKQQEYSAWYDPRSVAYHTVGRERMTLDYLCQRSYKQGISDSFAQIRKAKGLDGDRLSRPKGMGKKTMVYYRHRAREMSFSDWMKSFQNHLRGFRRRIMPFGQEQIRNRLQSAYDSGWKYHQTAVQEDPELLVFVLKKDYLE